MKYKGSQRRAEEAEEHFKSAKELERDQASPLPPPSQSQFLEIRGIWVQAREGGCNSDRAPVKWQIFVCDKWGG